MGQVSQNSQHRNIGISAHIDAGKTTLSERVLYYTGRIHRMGEVRGAGATMDHQELEREKGITISAAATWCVWRDHTINLIDTPGHVDFTVEVERSLRVLDGAILVLCAVAGVQPQTWTVDRQMRRHRLPRLAFVNKCDRPGADPARVVEGLRAKLGLHTALVQLPIGAGADFAGVIDLLELQAIRFGGAQGVQVAAEAVPGALLAAASAARARLVEAVAEVDDVMAAAWLAAESSGEPVPAAELRAAIRRATLACRFVPVLCGSAYHNIGVQPLLDAVIGWLPAPSERTVEGVDAAGLPVQVEGGASAPALALAFKQEEGIHGSLCWLRLYRGSLRPGDSLINLRTGRRLRVSRLLRIHAAQTVEIASAGPGDIVALPGADCASGDTLSAGPVIRLAGIEVPQPVMSVALSAKSREELALIGAALAKSCREDPSLRLSQDPESGQLLLHGMGELHLDVSCERVRRQLGLDIRMGAPQVAWREAITRRRDFQFTLSKQTGGPGMYARLVGWMEPTGESGDPVFESRISGGAVPESFVRAAEQGFLEALQTGPLKGAPVLGVRVVLTDGLTHPVDSSERAFRMAAMAIVREGLPLAGPAVLEPLLAASVEAPERYMGAVLGWLSKRRFAVEQAAVEGATGDDQGCDQGCVIRGLLPAAESFGLVNGLRSLTQGHGSFSLEFARYAQV